MYGRGRADPVADLTVQVATLILIVYGYWVFKRRKRKKLRRHAYAFTAATSLNAADVVLIMVPLFLDEWATVVTFPLGEHEVLLWVHHILGLLVTLMSLFVVVRWALNHGSAKKCRGRILMDSTTLIWVAALLLGFWLFAIDAMA
jgi:uncharacterized membrane protein YozB (DUF420 family)